MIPRLYNRCAPHWLSSQLANCCKFYKSGQKFQKRILNVNVVGVIAVFLKIPNLINTCIVRFLNQKNTKQEKIAENDIIFVSQEYHCYRQARDWQELFAIFRELRELPEGLSFILYKETRKMMTLKKPPIFSQEQLFFFTIALDSSDLVNKSTGEPSSTRKDHSVLEPTNWVTNKLIIINWYVRYHE